MAKFFSYFDDWKTRTFECRECGWKGTGDQTARGMYNGFMDLVCPRNELHETLAIVNYPTVEEMRAHQHIPWVKEQLKREAPHTTLVKNRAVLTILLASSHCPGRSDSLLRLVGGPAHAPAMSLGQRRAALRSHELLASENHERSKPYSEADGEA